MALKFNPFTGTFDFVNASFLDLVSVSTNTSMTSGKTYLVNTTSGALNMTLPAPALNAYVTIKDSNATFETNNVTVIPNGSEKIDTIAANYILNSELGSTTFVSNGVDWFVI